MFPAASNVMSRPLLATVVETGKFGIAMRLLMFGMPSTSGRMVTELVVCLRAMRYLPSAEMLMAAVEERRSPALGSFNMVRVAASEPHNVVELSLDRTKIEVLVAAGSSRFCETYHLPSRPRTISASWLAIPSNGPLPSFVGVPVYGKGPEPMLHCQILFCSVLVLMVLLLCKSSSI